MIVLFYRSTPEARNSQGLHSALVSANDLSAAEAALAAAAPAEVKVGSWSSLVVDADGAFDAPDLGVLWFEGDAVSVLGRRRGQ